MNGFIKIDRKIAEWGWYNDAKTFKLFFHLLLFANYKDADFCGIMLKRGQIVRSVSTLSAETGLTASEIRTAIKNLVESGDLTSTPHSKYTLFTVLNYDYYQPDNKQLTNKSQTNHEHLTSISQQYNKNNKDNKNNKYNNAHEETNFDENEFFRIALERSYGKALNFQTNKNPQHAVADS